MHFSKNVVFHISIFHFHPTWETFYQLVPSGRVLCQERISHFQFSDDWMLSVWDKSAHPVDPLTLLLSGSPQTHSTFQLLSSPLLYHRVYTENKTGYPFTQIWLRVHRDLHSWDFLSLLFVLSYAMCCIALSKPLRTLREKFLNFFFVRFNHPFNNLKS